MYYARVFIPKHTNHLYLTVDAVSSNDPHLAKFDFGTSGDISTLTFNSVSTSKISTQTLTTPPAFNTCETRFYTGYNQSGYEFELLTAGDVDTVVLAASDSTI
ncbi:MAG: hypothetical protein U9O94_10455 [Nanoarchaeota archaeon]|nr:hypothetical protein [Nanoarchaeota archaeon]